MRYSARSELSVTELLTENAVINENICANVKKASFYVRPVCGNILFSVGNALISCHGIALFPAYTRKGGRSAQLFSFCRRRHLLYKAKPRNDKEPFYKLPCRRISKLGICRKALPRGRNGNYPYFL